MPEHTTKNRINTYLTDAEKRLLEQLSAKRGLSISSFIRMLILEAGARDGLDPTEYAYLDDEGGADA